MCNESESVYWLPCLFILVRFSSSQQNESASIPRICKLLTARDRQTAVFPTNQSVKKISDSGTELVLEIRANSRTQA